MRGTVGPRWDFWGASLRCDFTEGRGKGCTGCSWYGGDDRLVVAWRPLALRGVEVRKCGWLGLESAVARLARAVLIRCSHTAEQPVAPRRLLDPVRDRLVMGHYSPRTVTAYVGWIRRFILFHGRRHPLEMAGAEVSAFLSSLATEGRVSA